MSLAFTDLNTEVSVTAPAIAFAVTGSARFALMASSIAVAISSTVSVGETFTITWSPAM